MCGRYVILNQVEVYEKRFNAVADSPPSSFLNFNVCPGQSAPVITNTDPHKIQFLRFGLCPFWAKKPMLLINARAEGDHNSEDDPAYRGARGIITKPAFRKPIRSQRCLILADAFIEGTKNEKLDRPFLVYLNRRPFAFAGIWDEWVNTETGEIIRSFAIITSTPNRLLQMIPHHRSPVILPERAEKYWLEDAPLSDITRLLEPPLEEEMNAYPISPAIKNPRFHHAELLHPAGPALLAEQDWSVVQEIKLQGMGYTKRENRIE